MYHNWEYGDVAGDCGEIQQWVKHRGRCSVCLVDKITEAAAALYALFGVASVVVLLLANTTAGAFAAW